jgi:hypothetical protein
MTKSMYIISAIVLLASIALVILGEMKVQKRKAAEQ